MTTVINLSLFNLNLNRPSTGDFHFNERFNNRNDDGFFLRESVIDVTPESRVFDDDETGAEDHSDKMHRAGRLYDPSMINITYDRNGRIVRHFHAKGMFLSAYV